MLLSWLRLGSKGGIHDDLIRIPGYFAFRKDRDEGRVCGGILVYVRDGLPFHAQPQLDKVDLEVLWLLYRLPLMPREVSHILVGAVYHPLSAPNGRTLDHLVSTMEWTPSPENTRTLAVFC